MAVKTISDLIVESINTGSDPVFTENGITYSFNPQGLKDYISGGASESYIITVNGKTPDESGNVNISATDVGAAKAEDIPSGRDLVPSGGTANQVLKIVSGNPAWAADTNTTYTAMTQAVATAGTSTTANTISAKVLNDAIVERLPDVGVAVADAVDDTDIVAQFNALLASLRAANIIAS